MPAVQYEVQIVKTGTGGAQAAAELKQVEVNAMAAKVSLAQMATVSAGSDAALSKVSLSSATLKTGARALAQDLKLLALVSFPQVATGAIGLEVLLKATSTTSKLLGTTTTAVGVTLSAIGVIVADVAGAWNLYNLRLRENQSLTKAMSGDQHLYETIQKTIGSAQAGGTITADQAAAFSARARAAYAKIDPGIEHNELVKLAQDIANLNEGSTEYLTLEKELTANATEGYSREIATADISHQIMSQRIQDATQFSQKEKDNLNSLNNQAQALRVQDAERKKFLQTEQVGFAVEREGLSDEAQRVGDVKIQYQQLDDQVVQLYHSGAISRDTFQQWGDQLTNSLKLAKFHASDLGQTLDQVGSNFSSGFSQAFTDFVSGTKSAEDAFRSFAVDFLKATSQMILQTIILNAVKAGINSYFGGGASSVGSVSMGGGDYAPTSDTAFANGGVRFAANGIMTVSRPTYLPKFNVVAGEVPGQPEMLTVLNNPRMMSIGGIQAAVGNAAGNKLAITGAEDLARAASGGHMVIEIRHSEAADARLISTSIRGAQVVFNRDVKRNTDTARNIKGLTQ